MSFPINKLMDHLFNPPLEAEASALDERETINASRLRRAEEAAGFGVWEADLATGMILLSAGAARLSGRPARETCLSLAEL